MLSSAHIHDLPQQVHKSLQESKSAGKTQHKLPEEVAGLQAERLLTKSTGSPRIITGVFPERDAVFIKLLAQKLTASGPDVIALLAGNSGQTALVFAQSAGQKFNMGQLMKEAMAQLGGRGGGTADMAQGGLPAAAVNLREVEKALQETAVRLAG